MEQDLYLNQLAEEFSIDKRDLKNQLRESVADRIAHTPRQFDPGPAPRRHLLLKIKLRKPKILLRSYQVWIFRSTGC
ncbi:hypothetical protein V6R94_05675 [Pediococcus acidilactici]